MTPNILFDNDNINKNNNIQKVVNKDFPHLRQYDTYDSGDRGEVYLFGNKLKSLFLNGALFISNINNWNTSLDQFRKKFMEYNVPNKIEIDDTDLSKIFFSKEELNLNQIWSKGHIRTRKSTENEDEDMDNDSENINISSKFNEMHQ